MCPQDPERPLELGHRRLERPPSVDEDQALPVLDDVDVDGAQTVHGQREWDTVHGGCDGLRPGFGPGITLVTRSGARPAAP